MSMTAASLMMAFTEQAAAQAQQNRSAYFWRERLIGMN